MHIGIEVSFYPLQDQYVPAIEAVIDELKADESLRVEVNTMSTQVFGDFERVFARLQQAAELGMTRTPHAAMVTKWIRLG